MVQTICRDMFFLSQKSAPATRDDLEIAQNLRDTLQDNLSTCVGMAANMIGKAKRIIAFVDGGNITVMLNPEIIKSSGEYEAEEGCLSLDGKRTAKRYKTIKVRYQNEQLQMRLKSYSDWTAQIIQHEIDHCNGILI